MKHLLSNALIIARRDFMAVEFRGIVYGDDTEGFGRGRSDRVSCRDDFHGRAMDSEIQLSVIRQPERA